MILLFYNLALLIALVAGAPWWLWRMATTQKYRQGLLERLGRIRAPQNLDHRPLLWIHAVSVGEVLAVSRLVKTLDAVLPEYFVAISTTTRTGQELARERFGAGRVFYCPLDLPWAVRTCLNALQPSLLVLAETEFWPNLLSACFRREIPIAVVNARVSDRSWPRYRRLRWLWRPFLSRLSRVLAQSETDADRLVAMGCLPDRVMMAGNLKFDVQSTEEAEATRTLKALKLGNRLIVAGSTLEGEEAALLAAWPRLLEVDPRLVLVLAPRHPERFPAVAALLEASGIPWKRRTAWREQPAGTIKLLQPGQIVLLDTIGELASVYSLASVAFVGGSLFPAGGHNPLEPAQFGVPIVMGSHYENFRAITDDLLDQEAIRISEPEDLAEALLELLQNRGPAAEMGERARQVFEQQAGATGRCVKALQELLPSASAHPETAKAEPSPAQSAQPIPLQVQPAHSQVAEIQSTRAPLFLFDAIQSAPLKAQSVQVLRIPAEPFDLKPAQPQPVEVLPILPEPSQDASIRTAPIEPAAPQPQLLPTLSPAKEESAAPPGAPSNLDPSQPEATPASTPEEPPSTPLEKEPLPAPSPETPRPPGPRTPAPFSSRKLLLPLVPAYKLALRVAERRLGTSAAPFQHLRFPVVSIGNLSTGGAGKTPLTIAVANALTRCGLQVDVLSRGYGRKSTHTTRVDPVGAAEEFGDEPILIARRARVPVYVAQRRFDAGLLAETDAAALSYVEDEPKPVVHLLDDGFQHRQLKRHADILLLDRRDWEDNLLPAGNLREPLTAIRRAGVLAVPASDPEFEAELKAWGWRGPVWQLHRKMELPPAGSLGAGPVIAFCGIARPGQFFSGLEASGLQLAAEIHFPDHHPYTPRDVERLISKARAAQATALITTEKDSVRLGKLTSAFPESLPLETVSLRIEIEHEDEALEWLLDRLPLSPSTLGPIL